jgi:hypothetical protein
LIFKKIFVIINIENKINNKERNTA